MAIGVSGPVAAPHFRNLFLVFPFRSGLSFEISRNDLPLTVNEIELLIRCHVEDSSKAPRSVYNF
jgi:hypothetical protein